MAISLNLFITPAKFGDGGFTGIALIIKYLEYFPNLPIENTIRYLNIPLVIIGIPFLGYRLIFHTILGVNLLSLALTLTKPLEKATAWHIDDPWLAIIFGGLLMGVGISSILKMGGNTGGSDIVARLVRYFTGIKLNYTFFIFDALVLTWSLIMLDLKNFLYTLIYIYIYSMFIYLLVEKQENSITFTVISNKKPLIMDKLHQKFNNKITIITGYDIYGNKQKPIFYIIAKKKKTNDIKNTIEQFDQQASIVIQKNKLLLNKAENFTAKQAVDQ